jgi:hypothetical protein
MVIGSKVMLQGDIAYGTVADIVINEGGCVDYLVIAEQDNYVIVPWSAATVELQERIVRIDVTRDRLRELTFTRERWPNLSSTEFRERIHTVFGDRAGRREMRNENEGTGERGRTRVRPPSEGREPDRMTEPRDDRRDREQGSERPPELRENRNLRDQPGSERVPVPDRAPKTRDRQVPGQQPEPPKDKPPQ